MDDVWWRSDDDLDGPQMEVVELGMEGSHLIFGPPGSGKSNLLLLRANYLTLAGRGNLAILVFTRQLQDFLRFGATRYKFPPERIQTLHSFTSDLLWQGGVRLPRSTATPAGSAFERNRLAEASAIREMLNAKQLGQRFDTILLDEAQDYHTTEIQNLIELSGRVFAVADDRQRIYDADGSTALLQAHVDRTITLRHHYRNGPAICRAADHIAREWDGDSLESTSNYDDTANPSSVDRVASPTIAAMATEIANRLATQLMVYPQSFLAVLVPLRADLGVIAEELRRSEIGPQCAIQADGSAVLDPNHRICVCTVHAAKGLEFRAVHIGAAEGFGKFRKAQKKMAYVALTRAKTALVIHHITPLPPYLEGAIGAGQGAPRKPSRRQLFGGE
jgi:superfamily I DNA/RNA helicase